MKTIPFLLLFACSLAFLGRATAQNASPAAGEKKIVITMRKLDKDGTETTTTIVKKGEAAENFNITEFLKANEAEDMAIDVRVEKGERLARRTPGYDNRVWEDRGMTFRSGERTRQRGYLGVNEDSDERSGEPGVVIEIIRGGAAERAGLRTNDLILTLDGREVNTWDDLSDFMDRTREGDSLRIAYRRGKENRSTVAILSDRLYKNNVLNLGQRQGFLGLTPEEDDDDDEPGVEIGIVRNSAAEKAGLREGDLIYALNDTEIADWEDISDFMEETEEGDTVRVTYRRKGAMNEVMVRLGGEKSWDMNIDLSDLRNLDINVRTKTACLGVYTDDYEDDDDEEGAAIEGFTDNSPAENARMEKGDVILYLNGARVRGHSDVWNEIARYQPGDTITVDYLRDGKRQSTIVTLRPCRDNAKEVTIFDTDSVGNNRGRQFYTWNWGERDDQRMRERKLITLHRGAEGDAQQVSANPPNVQERTLTLASFKIFPNPTPNQVTVEFRGEAVPTIVTIFDVGGRQLFREELNAFDGSYTQQFDLTEYAKGTMLVQVRQGERVFTEQMVVN
jgi:S1-C subfamily serine protease